MHELLLQSAGIAIEHMKAVAALDAHHRRQQPDRTGAGDKQRFWRPGLRAPPDALGMIPGLCRDTGGFQ